MCPDNVDSHLLVVKFQKKLKRKKRGKKLTVPSARTTSTRIQKCQSSPPTRSSPCCHRCHWPVCHPRSMPPNSHCDREISAHESIKPERQKICEQKTCEQKTYSPECPDNVDSRLPVVRSQITIELSPEPLAKELGFVGWKATLNT